MYDFRVIILFSITFFLAWLSVTVYRRSREHFAFSLFVGSVGLWALTLAFFYFVRDPALFQVVGRLVYVTGSIVPFMFYQFALLFTDQKKSWQWHILIALPNIALSYVYLFTNFFLVASVIRDGVSGFQYGSARTLFDLHFDLYFLAGFLTIYQHFRKERDAQKKIQYWFIFIGTLIGLVIAAFTNVFLPWFGQFQFLWAGPIGAGVWASILTYGILRHRILNIRVIATEIFAGTIWFILLINALLSATPTRFVFNAFLFVISIMFGYLLIRSVTKEVEQKEELTKLAVKLQEANEELKKLDVAKSEFISLASHQLRTPLTIIKGYISMALEGSFGKLKSELEKPIGLVMASTEDLIQLVNDLLDVSRIESGKIQYIFEPIGLADIVEKVIRELTETAKKKNIEIVFENRRSKNMRVRGDQYKLHEAVMNLLDNALKYSQTGPITVQLEETERGGVSYCRLSIGDHGMGIRAEDMPKLFTKFGRSEEAKQIQAGGMGIGLYFVKRVVEDHFGRVWAESKGTGQGSTFFVEVPGFSDSK